MTGHPRRPSFCEGLADAYANGARQAGAQVSTLHLAELDFDLDVHTLSPREQALEPDLERALSLLEWADHLVFVYPGWWGWGPARLKGFFDRVLLPGRAFKEQASGQIAGCMAPRTAHLLTTLDMPPVIYRWVYRAAGHSALKRSTLGLCGIETTRIACFGPVHRSDAKQRSGWLLHARTLGASLASGPRTAAQRWRASVGAWLRALRLQFYPMSWLAYTLGACLAVQSTEGWRSAPYWVGYGCVFLIKAATVFVNDTVDLPSDRLNRNAGPFTGGSRVLVEGRLSPRRLTQGALVALSGGVIALVALTSMAANPAALAAMFGMLTLAALAYTAPPFKLSWRGWGEIDVALTHSIGVMMWGYVVQGGDPRNPPVWLLSAPLALAILPAIVLSGIPDLAADRQVGKRTWVVRLGTRGAMVLAGLSAVAANVLAFALKDHPATAGALAGVLPYGIAHTLLLLGMLVRQCSRAEARIDALMVTALALILWFVGIPLSHVL